MSWPFELLNNFIISVVSCWKQQQVQTIGPVVKTFSKMLNLLSCKIQLTMKNHFLLFNTQCNLNMQVLNYFCVFLLCYWGGCCLLYFLKEHPPPNAIGSFTPKTCFWLDSKCVTQWTRPLYRASRNETKNASNWETKDNLAFI